MDELIAMWRAAEAESARLWSIREEVKAACLEKYPSLAGSAVSVRSWPDNFQVANEAWYASTLVTGRAEEQVVKALDGKVYRLPGGRLLVPVNTGYDYNGLEEYDEYS